MRIESRETRSQRFGSSIYLEYGADEEMCDEQHIEICERGLCFTSRWHWRSGTQLAIAFSFHDKGGELRKIQTEGVVVRCERLERGCYRATLIFLEAPTALRQHLLPAQARRAALRA